MEVNIRMGKIYMALLFLMIVPMLICIKYARKIKSDVASSIVKCLIFAIVTILSNGLFVVSQSITFSYFMQALYLFSFDMLFIYILKYAQQYTQVFNEVSPFRTGCFLVAYLDGLQLVLNVFFHNVFTLKTVHYMGLQMYQIDTETAFYYAHYAFVYCLMFCIIASFTIKIIHIPYFYRKKYFPILVVICVIVIINFMCSALQFPIDMSLPFFVCAAILICYLTLYRSPSELIDKTLSIVVTEMNSAVICFDINNECVYANERALNIFRTASSSESTLSEYVHGLSLIHI